jgi:hypothetical protein
MSVYISGGYTKRVIPSRADGQRPHTASEIYFRQFDVHHPACRAVVRLSVCFSAG